MPCYLIHDRKAFLVSEIFSFHFALARFLCAAFLHRNCSSHAYFGISAKEAGQKLEFWQIRSDHRFTRIDGSRFET